MDGEQVLANATESYRVVFGDRLLAAFALGSLAHGGFGPLSDIDLGLILSDPLEPADAEEIRRVADRHHDLSVFWGSPATLRGERVGGRFPALDRLDLIEHGRLLAGDDEVRLSLPPPDARELLVAGAAFALDRFGSETAAEEICSPDVSQLGLRRVTKLVLFPVRFLYTAATGLVAPNDAAVGRYLADERAPGKDLVAAALAWRRDPPGDEPAAAELVRTELLPIYRWYLDDHIERLESLGEPELAAGFREWRDRLRHRAP